MKAIIPVVVIVLTMIMASCHKNNETVTGETEMAMSGHEKSTREDGPAKDIMASADSIPVQAGGPSQTWEKKMIKTANITLELADYHRFNHEFHNNLKRFGAYIAQEQQQQDEYRLGNKLSVKVPVGQFDDLVNTLQGDGVKLLEKQVTAEDVSAEIVDTRGRIETKKQVRDKYYDFLKNARNMKEVLEVQQEINSLQEEIEAGSGRVAFLQGQSAYSTIHLNYYQLLQKEEVVTRDDFFTRISEAFQTGASIVTGAIVLMVTFWPVVLLIVAIVFARKIYSRSAMKKG